MRFACEYFQEAFDVNEGEPFTLVIENPGLFLNIVKDLYSQVNGGDGKIVFSEDNKIIKASKKVELITSFVPFDINEKRFITKLCSLIEKESLNEANFYNTMSLIASIENYINERADIFPYSIKCQGISAESLIKMCGLVIEDDSKSEIEKVFNYITVCYDLIGPRLFVLVNMRAFFSDEEMGMFAESCSKHKYSILMLENKEYPRLSHDNRLIVDRDLCII